jgi:hypothetical protein
VMSVLGFVSEDVFDSHQTDELAFLTDENHSWSVVSTMTELGLDSRLAGPAYSGNEAGGAERRCRLLRDGQVQKCESVIENRRVTACLDSPHTPEQLHHNFQRHLWRDSQGSLLISQRPLCETCSKKSLDRLGRLDYSPHRHTARSPLHSLPRHSA